MYIKIKDNQIEKYPYSISQLKQDNKDTSFPAEMSDERLTEWGMYPVSPTEYPQVDYTKNVDEGQPVLIGNAWTQIWLVSDKPQTEIDVIETSLRADAYRNESDPLFFKAQRGEIEQQVWLDKVAEIKNRYNKGKM
jgi:hypothetical protein